MSQSGGRIIVEQAYAQGKMLNHSGWSLERGITPSDVDFVIEASGCFLFAEFSRDCDSLACLSRGQQLMYRRLASKSEHDLVVVCSHSVPRDQIIDSQADINSGTVYFDAGKRSLQIDNEGWQWMVASWSKDPRATVTHLVNHHQSQQPQENP